MTAQPDLPVLPVVASYSRFEPSCNALDATRFVKPAVKVVVGETNGIIIPPRQQATGPKNRVL